MSYQERRSVVSLVGTLIIAAGYSWFIAGRAQAAGPDVANDLQFWATAILLLIPVVIVFQIILLLLFIVANIVATGRDEDSLTDEFGKLVNLKATRNLYHTFMASFVLSLAVVALGQPAAAMFIILLVGIFVASVVFYGSELFYFRRGV